MNLRGLDYIQGASGKNEIFLKCPYCEKNGKGVDSKYHLGVNTVKGIFHCFKCGEKGRVSNLAELSLLNQEDKSKDLDMLRGKLNNMFISTDRNIDLDLISWPMSAQSTPMAFKYMIDRGFTEEEINKYQLRVGKPYFDKSMDREINRYSGRIIFPFISDGKCVYFIARTLIGAEPKYLNSVGSKSTVVYNIDNVIGNVCIICEGIISAIAAERTIGIPAVAVLGKSISYFQLSRIRTKCNKIYLSFDSDVTDEEYRQIIRKAVKIFDEVYHVKLPHGDPDELKEEYKTYFNQATRVTFLDKMR